MLEMENWFYWRRRCRSPVVHSVNSQTIACQSEHKSRRFNENYLFEKLRWQKQVALIDGWALRTSMYRSVSWNLLVMDNRYHRNHIEQNRKRKTLNTNEFQSNSTLFFIYSLLNSWYSFLRCFEVIMCGTTVHNVVDDQAQGFVSQCYSEHGIDDETHKSNSWSSLRE